VQFRKLVIGGLWLGLAASLALAQSVAGVAGANRSKGPAAKPSRVFTDRDVAAARNKGSVSQSTVPGQVQQMSRPSSASSAAGRRSASASSAGQDSSSRSDPAPRSAARTPAASSGSRSTAQPSMTPADPNFKPGQGSTVDQQAKRYDQDAGGYYNMKNVARRSAELQKAANQRPG
jgi:hypothetical protein